MNVGELRELLENHDDDVEILIAHQPSWPLALNVAGVIHYSDREVECPDHEGYLLDHNQECVENYTDDAEDSEEPMHDQQVLWIVGGDHPYSRSPYAPRWLWDGEGWR